MLQLQRIFYDMEKDNIENLDAESEEIEISNAFDENNDGKLVNTNVKFFNQGTWLMHKTDNNLDTKNEKDRITTGESKSE